jgi:hypothetical protein
LCRCEDDIKIDRKRIGYEDTNLTELVEKFRWNTEMDPKKNILIS